MKKYFLTTLLFFTVLCLISQTNEVMNKEMKKYYRIKAHNFIKKTLGEKVFFDYFEYKYMDNSSYFSDSNGFLHFQTDTTKLKITYAFSIPTISYYTTMDVILNMQDSSMFFRTPERIPSFVLHADSARFISFKEVSAIVEGTNGKIKNWNKVNLNSLYSYKRGRFIYYIEIQNEIRKRRNYKKYNQYIIDAYTGEILLCQKIERKCIRKSGQLGAAEEILY